MLELHEQKTGLRVRGLVAAGQVRSSLSSLSLAGSSTSSSEDMTDTSQTGSSIPRSAAPGADVKLTLDINAVAERFDDRVRCVVNESPGQLGAKSKEFE